MPPSTSSKSCCSRSWRCSQHDRSSATLTTEAGVSQTKSRMIIHRPSGQTAFCSGLLEHVSRGEVFAAGMKRVLRCSPIRVNEHATTLLGL